MNRWLALDTASSRACVAVLDLDEKRVVAERGLDVPRRHAESIAGAVDACLEEASLSFADLDGFAAGRGPGSFVGVRVAIATAKGFALARTRPLVGFCSLVALAGHADVPAGEGLALIDARRGEVYGRPVVRAADGTLTSPQGVSALAPPAAAALLSSPAWLVGSGASLVAPHSSQAELVDVPGPDGAGMLAALLLAKADGIDDEAATLVPNYCRDPDAKKPGEK